MEANKPIGVFLAKFNPLTLHHERTIESALQSGVFEKIVVVPSDITAEIFRTPVIDRSNMVNKRYHRDPRVITFLPHTLSTRGLPWIQAIVTKLRSAGYTPVGVFLWEDYSKPKKRKRLHSMVGGDEYLVLYGKDEEGIDSIPDIDPKTGKKIITYLFQKPPGSGELRTYLSNNPQLFSNEKLFDVDTDTLPLSDPVREYIYSNRLYISPTVSGNVTDAFRNAFGTGLGKVLGRIPSTDEEVNSNVAAKLEELGLN